jgi:hypothetical protein
VAVGNSGHFPWPPDRALRTIGFPRNGLAGRAGGPGWWSDLGRFRGLGPRCRNPGDTHPDRCGRMHAKRFLEFAGPSRRWPCWG